jgi:hypothetical protein
MRPNVWFAPSVIETLSYYKGGKEELEHVESLLEDDPLRGRPYLKGIPAVRAWNKLFGRPGVPHNYVGALTWFYVFAPMADAVAVEDDEVIVFRITGPDTRAFVVPGDREYEEIVQEVGDMYNLLKASA